MFCICSFPVRVFGLDAGCSVFSFKEYFRNYGLQEHGLKECRYFILRIVTDNKTELCAKCRKKKAL